MILRLKISVAYHLLAFVDIALRQGGVFRFGEFVEESVAFVLGITVALQAFVLGRVLGQLELALHDDQREVLAPFRERILLQRVLGCDDAGNVVTLVVGVDVAEVSSQVVVELSGEELFLHQLVLQLKQTLLGLRA